MESTVHVHDHDITVHSMESGSISVEIPHFDKIEELATNMWQVAQVTRLGIEIEDDSLFLEMFVDRVFYSGYPEVIRLPGGREFVELTIHAHIESSEGGRQVYYFCLLERTKAGEEEWPPIKWTLNDTVIKLVTSEDQSTAPLDDMMPSARLALYGL